MLHYYKAPRGFRNVFAARQNPSVLRRVRGTLAAPVVTVGTAGADLLTAGTPKCKSPLIAEWC